MPTKAVDLICEDKGHESFFRPLIARIITCCGNNANISIYSDKRGFGGVKRAIRNYFAEIDGGKGFPDFLCVIVDSDQRRRVRIMREISGMIPQNYAHLVCIAICMPHVERLFFVDFAAFQNATGYTGNQPSLRRRQNYKDLLRRSVVEAAGVAPLDGLEVAEDLINSLDIIKFCSVDAAMRNFVDCCRLHSN